MSTGAPTIGGLKRLSRYLAGQLASAVSITGGTISGVTSTNNINSGAKRSTAQLDKTSDTTLAAVTGMSVPLLAGGTYAIDVYLPTTANASGGVKVALASDGTLTATSVNYTAVIATAAGGATVTTTTLGTGLGSTAAVLAAYISGVIVVNAAGSLQVQFAQNASFATASSALVNGYIVATRIA